MDDLIARIDGVLDEPDDEPLDDWQYPWVDSMRWAPAEVELPSGVWEGEEPEGELDGGWDYHPDAQVHVIPSDQVDEWTRCLDTLPSAERGDISWYVVCFGCMAVGEREVSCGCGNPSSSNDSR
ncbi:Uncharacterised protein [Mycobacteroides abscessus subsp. abscessus]|uniref:hypothetical protein n=1 Tax=Mycobacteroides abscessus TaxID=36809 RepID=UPI0005E7BF2A|nr:hypothetical protein [Mycobacteroides abscessus]MBE5505789.1 hypothetical protein [Mycobacteroides abscessus]MBN7314088.1 hypothetical protein [Mycobacteroides abscessus subsp. abscessus]MBN7329835.1 hypothetical protein [Mycobacteroides abscessus subsp. abscessus]MBN7564488.1 hypothetical protein [Mycobacteroides abscessus subsp. massiliense]MDO2989378.1 hypothetical protein [Mycobacteroides abscessus subsp. massiliense]